MTEPIPITESASRRSFIKGSGLMLAGGAIAGGTIASSELSVAKAAHAFAPMSSRLG